MLYVTRAADACSALTCADLGWSNGDAFGDARVCGASDALPLAGCSGLVNWTAALEVCQSAGARLCAADELSAARGTGCGYDDESVWSATECGEGAFIAGRGAGDDAEQCAASEELRYARCCADEACEDAARRRPCVDDTVKE